MMLKRTILFITFILSLCLQVRAQEPSNTTIEPSEYFDFWVGKWNLTWTNSNGSIEHGTNKIEKILKGKVLQENFNALDGEFKGYVGKSWSVYNERTGQWNQTWVDNGGAYLDFTGKIDGNRRLFVRNGLNTQGQPVRQRMIFYDITDDSFTWDWQQSTDKGEHWQLLWRINYRRS